MAHLRSLVQLSGIERPCVASKSIVGLTVVVNLNPHLQAHNQVVASLARTSREMEEIMSQKGSRERCRGCPCWGRQPTKFLSALALPAPQDPIEIKCRSPHRDLPRYLASEAKDPCLLHIPWSVGRLLPSVRRFQRTSDPAGGAKGPGSDPSFNPPSLDFAAISFCRLLEDNGMVSVTGLDRGTGPGFSVNRS